jgi:hypothetical protein
MLFINVNPGGSLCKQETDGKFGPFSRDSEKECCIHYSWDHYLDSVLQSVSNLKFGEFGFRFGIVLYRDIAHVVVPLGTYTRHQFMEQLEQVRSLNSIGGCQNVLEGI